MVKVRAFPGLRAPDPESFCVKPYDVISDRELAELRKSDNAVHIILPEGEGEEVYANARRAFHQVLPSLVRDPPSMYLYQESSPAFSQRGFIVAVSLEDYASGRIKKHEETREKPLKDRIKHIEATRANTGLVWTMFRSQTELKQVMDQAMQQQPLCDFRKFGYRHRLWRIGDSPTIQRIQSLLEGQPLYIADGHHRIAAAYEYSRHHTEEEAQYAMVFAASDDEVRILPYNRVVTTIERPDFEEALGQYFRVERLPQFRKPRKHEIHMYWCQQWWRLLPWDIPEDPVASLDVSLLQNKLLAPILGITDIRNDPRIFFVGGDLPREEYERLVDEEGNEAAFYLHPTSVQELEQVADEQLSMPPKSTWFDPKLLTGLVFHSLR